VTDVKIPLIGIRRETKTDLERRAPLTPETVRGLVESGQAEVCVEPSTTRIFADAEFVEAGARIVEDLSACDLVVGIKEIAPELIVPGKPHLIFSHTIKGQRYNMPLLSRVLEAGSTLIDYERVMDEAGRRLIFFGVQAGQAGMINTLWSLGQRLAAAGIESPFNSLRQAREYDSLDDACAAIRSVGETIAREGMPEAISPLICGIAGYGNVSRGAQEIYDLLGGKELAASELSERLVSGKLDAGTPWKVVFTEEDMVERAEGVSPFDLQEYYASPENYRSRFAGYLTDLTLLVNATYWDSRYPRWVTREDLAALLEGGEPRLRVIGDITCDPGGGIESTVKATYPDDPVYVYDPADGSITSGFDSEGMLVMAVDILPTELPRESSKAFSEFLQPFIIDVARADYDVDFNELSMPEEFKRAVIALGGELTPEYRYLEEHVQEWQREEG
jgi:saccharopine dehydrogenase (NAD+, L-lysine forming)